jgi:hypothetical protein
MLALALLGNDNWKSNTIVRDENTIKLRPIRANIVDCLYSFKVIRIAVRFGLDKILGLPFIAAEPSDKIVGSHLVFPNL